MICHSFNRFKFILRVLIFRLVYTFWKYTNIFSVKLSIILVLPQRIIPLIVLGKRALCRCGRFFSFSSLIFLNIKFHFWLIERIFQSNVLHSMRNLWWLNINKIEKRFYYRFSRIFKCKHDGGTLPIHFRLKLIFRVQSYRNTWMAVIIKWSLQRILHILKTKHWVSDIRQTPYWFTRPGHMSRHQ